VLTGEHEYVKWSMENGRWKMEDGTWKMEHGRWKMEDGAWKKGKVTVIQSISQSKHDD